MSEYADAKNYFQRLVNFSSASVYKDMLHHAIAAFDRAEKADAEVERLKGVLALIAVVDQGCGGNLTPMEQATSAMRQARSALEAKP